MSKAMGGCAIALVTAAAALLGSGCTSTSVQGVSTVHNREATRVWVIRRQEGMSSHQDEVLYCDVEMLRDGGELCQRWR